MFKLRAHSVEADLHASGLLKAFDGFSKGLTFKFADLTQGYFDAVGGAIGDGDVALARFSCTELSFRIPETNHITYEKNLTGSAYLVQDDVQMQTGAGTATVMRPGNFEHNFFPARRTMNGISTIMTVEAVDRYLATAGERRSGEIGNAVINGSGAAGPDRALLEFSVYVLSNFDAYNTVAERKRGKLAEALLVDVFVQLLQDIGSLKLKLAPRAATSRMVNDSKDYMQEHIGEPISISDVAKAANVSIRSLQHEFKKRLGVTPREYLANIRLERAREMLQDGIFSSVTTAALECGIMHFGRFSQKYRSRFGELPSETLQRARNRD